MKKDSIRELELLAPAADKNVAREAILHGADAVYMGGPSHGARKKAANSIEDIAETVKFAHQYRAKVYVTVNTIVYENELRRVENLCIDLYHAGVDALIVQDMSLLRLDLPPIALHASTQCDTRTVSKAEFLERVGMSQIVLARELSLEEISEIYRHVDVPLESFVHGALCVSYSGRCTASSLCLGRSANRGECGQMCRMPYTLRNGRGEVLEKDKYLLSLRDLNLSDSVEKMALAGVSSFKIEGRLKDADYVKNVTAHYRKRLDAVITKYPEKFRRASFGESAVNFTPVPSKSFNRGFTDYYVNGRESGKQMASILTPKSMGEVIADVNMLHNGDGISYFTSSGEYAGIGVNKVMNGKIIGSRPFHLPAGVAIHRTYDREWQQQLSKPTAQRTLMVDMEIDSSGITATDERGVQVRLPLECNLEPALKPFDPTKILGKLGSTIYKLRRFSNNLAELTFIPASQLAALRRRLTEALDFANEATYHYDLRRHEDKNILYPLDTVDERTNISNSIARGFYEEHGVKSAPDAVEIQKKTCDHEVMTTRYCLRRELGVCLKDKKADNNRRKRFAPPLTITTGPHTFNLEFDCVNCEMKVIKRSE
ncbi:MAG: U32 family peptidase [Muribaculaceae bacterium]|nr:U32 family peptidase [Muribaculaceae bacterium]